jgi:hypothetical protein
MTLKPHRHIAGIVGALATASIAAAAPQQQGTATAPPAKKKPTQPPGGANQVQGLNGKLGDVLFTGKWRFQVTDIKPVDSYTLKVPTAEQDYAKYHDVADNDLAAHSYKPKEGYALFAVTCVARNGQNKTEQLDFYLNDPKTALTDDQANSYPPIVYDMQSKGAWVTKPLLPGSKVDMVVLFAVPTGTKPKDLVFTLKNWEDHAGKEVRIALPPPAAPATSAPAPAAAPKS